MKEKRELAFPCRYIDANLLRPRFFTAADWKLNGANISTERERSSYLWWKKIQGREKPVVFILLLLFAVRAECCGGGGEEREVRTARRLRGLHLSKVSRISIYSTKGAQGATIPILTHHVHHHPPKGIRPDQQRWNLGSAPVFLFDLLLDSRLWKKINGRSKSALFFFDIDWKKKTTWWLSFVSLYSFSTTASRRRSWSD